METLQTCIKYLDAIVLFDVLAILDKLEIQQVATLQYTRHTIDGILSINKIAVAQCSPMLDCLRCRSIPGCAMLLILVCRDLVSQFQRVLSFHSSQYKVIANPHSHQSERMPSDLISGRPASLGNYCIDTLEEWIQMLHTLVTFRGRSLAVFMDKLKRFVSDQNCADYRDMIVGIESRHRSLMASLQKEEP